MLLTRVVDQEVCFFGLQENIEKVGRKIYQREFGSELACGVLNMISKNRFEIIEKGKNEGFAPNSVTRSV